MSLGEMRYGNELMWTVMYKFESFRRGASGDGWDGDEDGGVDSGTGGVSTSGIGFGEGKFCDVDIVLRRCAGAAISCEERPRYLSVYTHLLTMGLPPLSAVTCVISVSYRCRQMFVFLLPQRSHQNPSWSQSKH